MFLLRRRSILIVNTLVLVIAFEFEFDDMDIEGGNISTNMAYLFLLAFIFLMVIVLMNLLNGLAVSDTAEMIKDSRIESQVSFINTIRYFESVYLDIGLMRCTQKKGTCLNTFFQKRVVPMKMFVFQNPYLQGEMKLTLPLKERPMSDKILSICPCCSKDNTGCCKGYPFQNFYLKVVCEWFLGGDENIGSEDFLANARNILIQLKQSAVNDRKLKELAKEIGKMRKKKTLNDKIKNIENILLRSFKEPSNQYN